MVDLPLKQEQLPMKITLAAEATEDAVANPVEDTAANPEEDTAAEIADPIVIVVLPLTEVLPLPVVAAAGIISM